MAGGARPPVIKVPVLIAGGGPVGLTLAIELGLQGTACLVVERNDKPRHLPKMELCNARSMEIYRRLGLAEAIRGVGYPADASMDIFVTTSMQGPPLAHLHYPSSAQMTDAIAATDDGTAPREAYQRISQYTLEPLLRRSAEAVPGVDVRFGTELTAFAQDGDGVTAELRTSAGEPVSVRADYLVGADGGRSIVRQLLGVPLQGVTPPNDMWNCFFRSDNLIASSGLGPGRHYYFAGPLEASLITQDDLRHHSLHTVPNHGMTPQQVVETLVGGPVEMQVLYVGEWTPHLLIADHYRQGRVLLAGDSAHQVIPMGGFGLNTGIGDADDLAWKLAGTIAGWGGPGLLGSYEPERRRVGVRNLAASGYAFAGHMAWRGAHAAGEPAATVERIIDREQRKSHEMSAIELGYQYDKSPITWRGPGDEPEPDSWPVEFRYRPSSVPGARLPHVWLSDGTALHDQFRLGEFTYLRLTPGAAPAGPLLAAFGRYGAPIRSLDINDDGARRILRADAVLLRPDLHIAWRSDGSPPPDAVELAALVLGYSPALDMSAEVEPVVIAALPTSLPEENQCLDH